jgi:hypothetical protein
LFFFISSLFISFRTLELWKADLKNTNEKMADALADPVKYPNLFADYEWALKVEKMFLHARSNFVPAAAYPSAKADLDLNLIELLKSQPSTVASSLNHHSDIGGNEIEKKMEDMTIHSSEEHSPSRSIVDEVVPSSSGAVSPKQPTSPVPFKPVDSPTKPISSSLPSPPPSVGGSRDEDVHEEESDEHNLNDVLAEEDRLLNQSSSSPSKALPPSPPPVSLQKSPVSLPKPADDVVDDVIDEEEDVDLEDLGEDENEEEDVAEDEQQEEGKDILENDDNEGFESGEDW